MTIPYPNQNSPTELLFRSRRQIAVAFLVAVALSTLAPGAHSADIPGYLGIEIVGNRVVHTRYYTPSERGNLQPGDEIVSVDDVSVEGKGRDAIMAKLTGPAGTFVKLKILRDEKPLEVSLKYEEYPPGVVPKGLTAGQYYALGIKQRELGFPNESRECLKLASSLDPHGTVGEKSQRYLNTEVPLYYVKEEVQTMNNKAWNLSRSGKDDQAEALFRTCIKLSPNFEWPRNNLAGILIDSKRYKEAQVQLDYILNLHPTYVSSWLTLAHLKHAQGEIKAAKGCAAHALKLNPDSKSAKSTVDWLNSQ